MSADKISIAVLEEFIKKVRMARRSRQTEIRLNIDDAENVAHNLSLISLRLLDPNNTPKETEVISIVMDGGSLEEKR